MRNSTQNKLIQSIMVASFALMLLLFLAVPLQIVISGIGAMDNTVFSFDDSLFSVLPTILNTFWLMLGTLCIAAPIAVFAAMFLWFYEHHIPHVVRILQALIDSLSAVPSIVYALFGLIFFVGQLSFGFSILSGIFTMTIIVLPVLIRASEQALHSIPKEVYLSGLSLGLSRFYVMCNVLLPQAYRGILSGVILAVGRIVGESAALIFTMGTAAGTVSGPFSSGRTIAVQVYSLAGEGLYLKYAYATSFVLLIFVVILQLISFGLLGK